MVVLRSPLAWPVRLTRRHALALAVAVLLTAMLATGSDRRPAAFRQGTAAEGPRPTAFTRPTLRVGSFNIHSGRDAQGRQALELTAASLAGIDLVGLCEVRGGFTAHDNQAATLGRQLGLAWIFAPSERRWWHDHWGNALLSSLPVGRWQSVPLLGTRGKAYRSYLHAEVRFGHETVEVIVAHIDTADDHAHQLQTVAEVFCQLPEPALLLGDLNATRRDPVLARLLTSPGVIDCQGHSGRGDDPGRIDWILARGLVVRDAGQLNYGASDHPCLWADLELPAALLAGRPSDAPPPATATPAR